MLPSRNSASLEVVIPYYKNFNVFPSVEGKISHELLLYGYALREESDSSTVAPDTSSLIFCERQGFRVRSVSLASCSSWRQHPGPLAWLSFVYRVPEDGTIAPSKASFPTKRNTLDKITMGTAKLPGFPLSHKGYVTDFSIPITHRRDRSAKSTLFTLLRLIRTAREVSTMSPPSLSPASSAYVSHGGPSKHTLGLS